MRDERHLMRILHFIALDLPVTAKPPTRPHTGESADPLLNEPVKCALLMDKEIKK